MKGNIKLNLLWLFDITIFIVYMIFSLSTNGNGCILGLNESQSRGINTLIFGGTLVINLWVISVRNIISRLKLITSIFFLFVFIFIIAQSLKVSVQKTPGEIITKKRLNDLKILIEAHINTKDRNDSFLLAKSTNSICCISNLSFNKKDTFFMNQQTFIDAWGLPFNVDYTTNIVDINGNFLKGGQLTNHQLSRQHLTNINRFAIIVWSSGENHKDERCLGDDIIW